MTKNTDFRVKTPTKPKNFKELRISFFIQIPIFDEKRLRNPQLLKGSKSGSDYNNFCFEIPILDVKRQLNLQFFKNYECSMSNDFLINILIFDEKE